MAATTDPNSVLPPNPDAAKPYTPGTFSYILEADHDKIRACLGPLIASFKSLQTPKPTPATTIESQVLDLTWRLIRHDVCEELVMRPAYTQHLGPGGAEAAEYDRHDHADAKQTLLSILPLAPTNPEFISKITAMIQDLSGHMIRESGHEIPLLESTITATESKSLADAYTRSQLLTPELTWEQVHDSSSSTTSTSTAKETGKIWSSVLNYAKAPMPQFSQILSQISPQEQTTLGTQIVAENLAAVTPDAEAFTQNAMKAGAAMAVGQGKAHVAGLKPEALPQGAVSSGNVGGGGAGAAAGGVKAAM